MSDLITPDELPVWVPGELTVDSAPLGWEGVRIRGYRYAPLDVPIPGMRDYMIVAYKHGATQMNRRCTGDWRNERVARGCVSLLTHAAQSHWRWGEDIEVTHVYLSPETMAQVAADAYDRHIKEVELRDVLRADDPVLVGIAAALAQESQEAGLGGRLYVEALRNHACVHILRHYANVIFREPGPGGLSRAQCRLLNQYLGRKPGPEHLVGGAGGRRAAQRVSLHAQIPNRIRLPSPHLRHAQAHRARQGPSWPRRIFRSKRRGQQRLLRPEPYDASVPPPAWRHAVRLPQGQRPVEPPAAARAASLNKSKSASVQDAGGPPVVCDELSQPD